MRNPYHAVALARLLLAPMFSTMQAQILDQSSYLNSGNSTADVWSGQTFTASANTSAGAGFNLYASSIFPASGLLTVELWSGVASNAGAIRLASGTSAFSLAGQQQSMIDVFWDAAVSVTPGTQYFLTMNAPGNAGNLARTSGEGDPYAGGQPRPSRRAWRSWPPGWQEYSA